MKLPKTIKGWIKIMKAIETMHIMDLKGFDKLTEEEKIICCNLATEISNHMNEYPPMTKINI